MHIQLQYRKVQSAAPHEYLHAKNIQEAVMFLNLTSWGGIFSKITNSLDKLLANATLARWLLLKVAVKTSQYMQRRMFGVN
jgi:hypothetical protein